MHKHLEELSCNIIRHCKSHWDIPNCTPPTENTRKRGRKETVNTLCVTLQCQRANRKIRPRKKSRQKYNVKTRRSVQGRLSKMSKEIRRKCPRSLSENDRRDSPRVTGEMRRKWPESLSENDRRYSRKWSTNLLLANVCDADAVWPVESYMFSVQNEWIRARWENGGSGEGKNRGWKENRGIHSKEAS